MPKTVELTPEARDVLTRATIEPLWVFLPTGQLDREVYVAVDKFLKALGGKWHRGQRGHKFERGTAEVAAAISAGQAVDQKRTLEQFFTPRHIAQRLALALDIAPGMDVLEPSAGAGDLIEQLIEAGVREDAITAVEIDPALVSDLHCRFPKAKITAANFLALPLHVEAFDRVAMNPPFGRGADMAHVKRAFSILRTGGKLGAIMSPHWTFANDQASVDFRALIGAHQYEWTPLPDGSFSASGTGVNTGILIITKGAN